MDKECLVERENFQVTKEKIIKTNDLLQRYQEKTERLNKATQAYKQLKSKQQNVFQESLRLKMDNERLTDGIQKNENAIKQLAELHAEYKNLEGKYEQHMIETQLTITEFEEKVKQCCCDKSLATLSPKRKTADDKIRDLKQLCSELKDVEHKLTVENKTLMRKVKKLEDAAEESKTKSLIKECKEINSLKEQLTKANSTIQEQNRLNNTIKSQKEESENERVLLKTQISILEDKCRCLTELLSSAKNRDIDRCDIFTQTENSLPQDEKTVSSSPKSKHYDIDSDEFERILKEIRFTDPLLSPIRSDTPVVESRRSLKVKTRSKKENIEDTCDKKLPKIVIPPPTPLIESSEICPVNENKQNATSSDNGFETNGNHNLHTNVNRCDNSVFESNARNISTVNNDSEKNDQYCDVDNYLFPKNQIPFTEEWTISSRRHEIVGPSNVASGSASRCIENELICKDSEIANKYPRNEVLTIEKDYPASPLIKREKQCTVKCTDNEFVNEESKLQRDSMTGIEQTKRKKSQEHLVHNNRVKAKMKAKANRKRKIMSRSILPTLRKSKKSESGNKCDTILNALTMLKANNISFTISSESIQLFPNFTAAPPKSEYISPTQSEGRSFSCETICWHKKCVGNGMMLREVHKTEEPELLGFYNIKNEARPSSVGKKIVEEQPGNPVEQLARELLHAFKKINSPQKRPDKKCYKPRRSTSSEFKSATESELERLFDSPDVLRRNKRMLAAARKQTLRSAVSQFGQVGRESDIDGLFDSGLVTATTKHDTDSQSFLSCNENDMPNTLLKRECCDLPASSDQVMDLMQSTPTRMNKLHSPLSSSIKSITKADVKEDAFRYSKDLTDRCSVETPEHFLPELSINTVDLNCSVGQFNLHEPKWSFSSLDELKGANSLLEGNQEEFQKIPSKTKVDSSGTESTDMQIAPSSSVPSTRIIELRKKNILVEPKIQKKTLGKKQCRRSLRKSSRQSDSDCDNEKQVQVNPQKVIQGVTKKSNKVPNSENDDELSVGNLDDSVELNQSSNTFVKRTKAVRRTKAKSKSSKKIVSRQYISETDSDGSPQDKRAGSRNKFMSDQLNTEAIQEHRLEGQRSFSKKILTDESLAPPSSRLKKSFDKKDLFGSESDSSSSDTNLADDLPACLLNDEREESEDLFIQSNLQKCKLLSTGVDNGVQIKDRFKQEVSYQISIPDSENDVLNEFNSMADESSKRSAWSDNVQIRKDHIADTAALEQALKRNFDEFKTKYRVKNLRSKKVDNVPIINRASSEEENGNEFPCDQGTVENSQNNTAVDESILFFENSPSASQTVYDPGRYSQSNRGGKSEDTKTEKKIHILEDIIVAKGVMRLSTTSNCHRSRSDSDLTDQNIVLSHEFPRDGNVRVETEEKDQTAFNNEKCNDLSCSLLTPALDEGPESTNKVMPRGEILDAMSKLILFSKDVNVLDEVVNKFAGSTADYVAFIILGKLCQDIFDKPNNDHPPGPVMTSTQRILLGFLVKLENSTHKGILNKFLDVAELQLFKKFCNVDIIQPITRVYTAICRMRMNVNRIRRFICECFYFSNSHAISIFFIVLTMWGSILPMASDLAEYPLAKVIVQLCYTIPQPGAHAVPLRDLLQKYFGYPADHWEPNELFEELLDEYIKNPFKRQSDFALLLFLKNRPAKWVFQKIKQRLMVLFERIPNDNPNLKANLLIFMANICHSFRADNEEEWLLIAEMNQWLGIIQNVEGDVIVQKSIMLAKERLPEKRVVPDLKEIQSCKGQKINKSVTNLSSNILEPDPDRNQ